MIEHRPLLLMGLLLLPYLLLAYSLQLQLALVLHLGPQLDVQFVPMEHHQPNLIVDIIPFMVILF